MSLAELRAFLQGCIPAWGQDLVSSTLTTGVGADKAEGVNMVTPRSPLLGGARDSPALSLAAVPLHSLLPPAGPVHPLPGTPRAHLGLRPLDDSAGV